MHLPETIGELLVVRKRRIQTWKDIDRDSLIRRVATKRHGGHVDRPSIFPSVLHHRFRKRLPYLLLESDPIVEILSGNPHIIHLEVVAVLRSSHKRLVLEDPKD